MRNFARIIDLGVAECCLHRRGSHELVFDFWLREGSDIISPTAIKVYDTAWLLDALFDSPEHDAILTEAAQKVLDVVLHQMSIHDDELEEKRELYLDRRSLDMLHSPDAD